MATEWEGSIVPRVTVTYLRSCSGGRFFVHAREVVFSFLRGLNLFFSLLCELNLVFSFLRELNLFFSFLRELNLVRILVGSNPGAMLVVSGVQHTFRSHFQSS